MNKTTIFILAIFASLFVISSCKKDYSCKCTGTYLGISGDTTITLVNMKKKDAKAQCNNYQSTYGALAILIGASITCELD